MYGYSSFDNYFGLNQQCMMNPNMMMGMNPYRTGSISTIPGINAPKENKNEAGKFLACLVGGTAALILLIKGKGKISTVFKKFFGKDAASKAAKKGADKVADDVAKVPFFKRISNKLFRKNKTEIAPKPKKTNVDGDYLEVINGNVNQLESKGAEKLTDASKILPDAPIAPIENIAGNLTDAGKIATDAPIGTQAPNIENLTPKKVWAPDHLKSEDIKKTVNTDLGYDPEIELANIITTRDKTPEQFIKELQNGGVPQYKADTSTVIKRANTGDVKPYQLKDFDETKEILSPEEINATLKNMKEGILPDSNNLSSEEIASALKGFSPETLANAIKAMM